MSRHKRPPNMGVDAALAGVAGVATSATAGSAGIGAAVALWVLATAYRCTGTRERRPRIVIDAAVACTAGSLILRPAFAVGVGAAAAAWALVATHCVARGSVRTAPAGAPGVVAGALALVVCASFVGLSMGTADLVAAGVAVVIGSVHGAAVALLWRPPAGPDATTSPQVSVRVRPSVAGSLPGIRELSSGLALPAAWRTAARSKWGRR